VWRVFAGKSERNTSGRALATIVDVVFKTDVSSGGRSLAWQNVVECAHELQRPIQGWKTQVLEHYQRLRSRHRHRETKAVSTARIF
jgi:hypothetical protein